ncbi:hypothetical protein [Variovorax sp. KK3]|uniref:hypothetical protein n=1 Tax=Variovorax sp. KK3 TaxID=1855728 RepID=UPI00097BC623|nr:hypothetical protein [Variovorax sp. KK3]
MRVLVCLIASIAAFVGLIAAWWFYWPVWQVESRVKSRLADPAAVHFSGVVYDKRTGTACGYVNPMAQGGQGANGGSGGKTHFILMADGDVRFDPKDPVRGSTLQQLEGLRKQADYLALAYAHCQRG